MHRAVHCCCDDYHSIAHLHCQVLSPIRLCHVYVFTHQMMGIWVAEDQCLRWGLYSPAWASAGKYHTLSDLTDLVSFIVLDVGSSRSQR